MNQISPVLSQPVNCVNPTGLVGFTQLFFTRAGCAGCVNPDGLVGFTQLVFTRLGSVGCVKPTKPSGFTQLAYARLMLTKRIFTQLGLIEGVDDKQTFHVIRKNKEWVENKSKLEKSKIIHSKN